MAGSFEDALSSIGISAKFLGIRASKNTGNVFLIWGSAFQLFQLVYTIVDLYLRSVGGENGDIDALADNIVVTIITIIHKLLFVALLLALVHFNHFKRHDFLNILKQHDRFAELLRCTKICYGKIKKQIFILSVTYNILIFFLYLCDNWTWASNMQFFISMLQSNLVTANWVTSELIFLSVVFITQEMFLRLNLDIEVFFISTQSSKI